MKKLILIACFSFAFVFQAFPQDNTVNDNWKNKWLYTSAWAGYGSGFSMGLGIDAQLANIFALGLELGLADRNYPAISIFPKLTFKPGRMQIDLYAGVGFAYSTVYDFVWGVPHGIALGFNVGNGLLFIDVRNGMGWSVGIGYRMGFLDKNKISRDIN